MDEMRVLVCRWNGLTFRFRYRVEPADDAAGRIWRYYVFDISDTEGQGECFLAQFHEIARQRVVLSEGLEAPRAFRQKGIPAALFELVSRETSLRVFSSTENEQLWWLFFEKHSIPARRMWMGLARRNMARWHRALDRFEFVPQRRKRFGCLVFMFILGLLACVAVKNL
jgi:hypothetical protein